MERLVDVALELGSSQRIARAGSAGQHVAPHYNGLGRAVEAVE
jgi:hypothetical protein